MVETTLRSIRPEDQPAVAEIIRRVLTEFGVTGPASSLYDPEVDSMFDSYQGEGRAYFVLEQGGRVVGGAGFAPLDRGEPGVCELRKMYLLPEARGHGQGKRILMHVIEAATAAGHRTMYLETVRAMTAARGLYERCGFVQLDSPMGNTGHTHCDLWFARGLGKSKV